jgi:hypothetical protein
MTTNPDKLFSGARLAKGVIGTGFEWAGFLAMFASIDILADTPGLNMIKFESETAKIGEFLVGVLLTAIGATIKK